MTIRRSAVALLLLALGGCASLAPDPAGMETLEAFTLPLQGAGDTRARGLVQ